MAPKQDPTKRNSQGKPQDGEHTGGAQNTSAGASSSAVPTSAQHRRTGSTGESQSARQGQAEPSGHGQAQQSSPQQEIGAGLLRGEDYPKSDGPPFAPGPRRELATHIAGQVATAAAFGTPGQVHAAAAEIAARHAADVERYEQGRGQRRDEAPPSIADTLTTERRFYTAQDRPFEGLDNGVVPRGGTPRGGGRGGEGRGRGRGGRGRGRGHRRGRGSGSSQEENTRQE